MQEVKLGTIGSGVIVHSILDNVNVTDGIRLAAVYSRSEEKGKALAAEYGVDKVYTEMDAFLADHEVNFVYIADIRSGMSNVVILTVAAFYDIIVRTFCSRPVIEAEFSADIAEMVQILRWNENKKIRE